MEQQNFYEVAQDIAILGGVGVGIFAVFSPSWVWFKKQLFGWGGGVLCAFGTILIVASIFKTVSLALGPGGVDFRLSQQLAELQKQVADVKTAALETNRNVAEVTSTVNKIGADRIEVAKVQQQLDQLSVKITQLTQASDATSEKIQKVLEHSPANDQGKPTLTPYITPKDDGSKYQKD